ncbi:MAG: TetR/AcrR family transcriptional regulator [Bacteroidales bacterium]|nr:TetR/AcrR family transcriptional regulator [Bacteroidales bacterium]
MQDQTTTTTEKRILEAAEEEFLESGYDGARTVSIAEKAGVTHAMLHYYFRSKEQLFQRILDEKVDILINSVMTAFFDSGKPLIERIEDGISAHMDFLAANEKLPLFVVREVGRRDIPLIDRLRDYAGSKFGEMQQEMDALAEQGIIRKTDALMLFFDIISQNVFPFLILPAAMKLVPERDKADLLEQLKRENIQLIQSRLKV